MSDKKDIIVEIRKWCNSKFRTHFCGYAVNLEGDRETVHIALFPRKKRSPELDKEISELKEKFRAEILVIDIYEGRPVPKKHVKGA